MALALKLPAIAPWRDFVVGGGLMSYGPNYNELFKTAAQQVARVLKGDKPGAIPVAVPAPELVVSQRNARHIGVALPQSLVGKAKEVLN
jgi:putative ABC transport system substrate-binding protein